MPRNLLREGDLSRYLKDGLLRTFLEQGVMLGWGDEAEAYLRSKLADHHLKDLITGDPNSYEHLLKQIQGETAKHYEDYPTSTSVAELAGNAIPFLWSNPATLPRMMGMSALEGGIYGSGTAEEGERLQDAATTAAAFGLSTGALGSLGRLAKKARARLDQVPTTPGYAEGGKVDQPGALTNIARAVLGQGAMLGWGDEAEAALRSMGSDTSYDEALAEIRKQYGTYAKGHPYATKLGEFGGAASDLLLAALSPRVRKRLMAEKVKAVINNSVTGGVAGTISGAGAAENDPMAGAAAGAGLGAIAGAVVPAGHRGARAMGKWALERAFPTAERANASAANKLLQALGDMPPSDIQRVIGDDRAMGVPSMTLNTNQGLSDLAEAVTQRTGAGARVLTGALNGQRQGMRERIYQQVRKALQPGRYYEDEARYMKEMRDKAAPLYEAAYGQGMIDDPRINSVLQVPQFQTFFKKAQEIAKMEETAARLRGEDPTPFQLKQLYEPTGEKAADGSDIMKLTTKPDVRTLDYIKRGMDTVIDRGFNGEGISKPEAAALRDLRKQFVGAIDENSEPYRLARKSYAGDMEVLDALHAGMEDFNRLDHEQVQQLVAGMGPTERDAYRTGVARQLYSRVMDPSSDTNSARRLIGSPELQAKLAPLFDSPAQFKLFKTALERESELFQQANRVLGGSPTSRREQMRGILEDDSAVGDAVRNLVTGGWWNSVTGMATKFIRGANVTDEVAERLAKMLASKDPDEVAAVVKLLEDHAQRAQPRALKAGAAEAATTAGLVDALWSPPEDGGGSQ